MMLVDYFTILLLFSVCVGEEYPLVVTCLGRIRGTLRTSLGGRKYAAFEGIPYAKPPIGNLRFEEPQPVEPWTGTWNASFLTECPQIQLMYIETMKNMAEDCLYINVYAPIDARKNSDVIVYIHGGAYMYGSGHAFAHPRYIMDHDVIFVTFNYRLGVFGFLSTQDDVVPGNNGLKDQVLALKWVKNNIAKFGGNRDSVTLTGVSAGGASVHLHYLSRSSRGLFHKGVSQSGTALNSWSLQKEPLTKAKLLADSVGCPTSPSSELVKCLKQRPYHHLLASMPLFFGYRNILPLAPFGPVVERGSKKAFLIEQPNQLLMEGRVYGIPWICSNVAHEGFMPFIFANDTVDLVNKEWEDLAPFMLDFNYTAPKSRWKEISRKIKDFYLGPGNSIDMENNLLKSVAIFSDRMFLADAEEAVSLHARNSPVYYYLFSFLGQNTFSQHNLVTHGGDAPYSFGYTYSRKPLTEDELAVKDMMMEMFVSYANTGKPTIDGVHWEPTKSGMLEYLHFTSHKREENKFKRKNELTPGTFWKSLCLQENEMLLRYGTRYEP